MRCFVFPASFPGVITVETIYELGAVLSGRLEPSNRGWEGVAVWGGSRDACGTLDLFDATLRFSNLVLLDGSSAHI